MYQSDDLDLGQSLKIKSNFALANSLIIHAFCDADASTYGAILYNMQTHSCTKLLIAKERVVPIKVLSINQLELTAANLADRLIDCTICKHASQQDKISVHVWTDSMIVLRWNFFFNLLNSS